MVFVNIQFRALELGANGLFIGVIMASTFVIQTLISPWWGAKSDQYGRKTIFLICTFLSAVSILIYGFAPNLWLILLSRILAGFGGANVAIAQASVVDDSNPEHRTKILGRLGAAQTAGMIAGPAAGGFVGAYLGTHWIGIIGFAASATGLILATIFAELRGQQAVSTKPKFGFGPLIRDFPRLIPFIVIASVAWFSLSTLEGTFGRLLISQWGFGEKEMGAIFSFESFTSFVIQGLLLGWLTSKIKDRTLLSVGYLVQGIGLAITPFVPDLLPLFGASLLFAAGTAIANPTLNGLASQSVSKDRQGELFGVLHSARSIGFAIGPLIGGVLFDWKPIAPYLLAGSVCVITSIIVLNTIPKNPIVNPQA